KLYHYPATRSARARWALLETLGEDFEIERIELYQGIQYTPAYLDKNPNHNVPILEITRTDGTVHIMLESAAMVAWLADAFPEKELAPAPGLSLERADYLQMLHFAGGWMDMMLWQIRLHEHLLSSEEADPRTTKRYRNKFVTEVEPQLKGRLTSTDFICGMNFSAADILIGHNMLWAQSYQLCEDPIFKQYLSRLSARPAFIQAFADAEDFEPEPPARKTA
ncbi:MAG TPA: glutathione S-transferase family protein, partial [Gammaproteobacteria bacterium]|nr:glutathione S-transferase family protein [Gammaproteobacteria bacterium]